MLSVVGSNKKRKTMASLTAAIFLIVIFGSPSLSVLLTRPRNTFANYPTTINCSSSLGSASIVWYFTLFNTSNNETIAVGATVMSNFTSRISIQQPNPNASSINFVSYDRIEGTYTCSDSTSIASAELLNQVEWIYNNRPNSTKSGLIFNGDTFYVDIFSCYYGNDYFTPILYIELKNSSIAQNFTNTTIDIWTSGLTCAGVTFYATATCDLGNPLMYHVYTYFSQPKKSLPPYSATNAPDTSSYTQLRVAANIICTVAEISTTINGLISESMAYYGSELICEALSDFPMTYTWTDITYGNTTKGQRFIVWHNGSYQCNASSALNGTLYLASTTVTNLIVIKFSSSASPLFGPIAGGTKIDISIDHWSEQSTNVSAVYLGNHLTASIASENRENGTLTVVTPNVTEDLQKPLVITLEFTPGRFNITTDHYFQYRSNPKIFGLDPDNFISTGGTTVLVNGSDLSSVANPLIQLTVVVTRIDPSEDFSNATIDSCHVLSDEGTQMTCNMPPANLPTDFLGILDESYSSNESKTMFRNNSNANALEVIGPNGIDKAVVYLGFILDGYTKYQNINEELIDVKINFYSPPEINSSNKVFKYDPKRKELFQIKGNYLSRGSRLTDYLVHVGDDICQNVDLTDNDLRCRLPDRKPQLTENDTLDCEKFFSVRINLGHKIYQYSCLQYASQIPSLIIGLCVGIGGLLLIIVVITLVCCCSKRKRQKQSDSNDHSSPYRNGVMTSNYQGHERPNETRKANDNYLQAIELE